MINQLKIHDFRGISTGKIDRLRQFNLFIGPNNAGKSAVLETIYLTATADRPANLTISDSRNSENYTANLPAKDMLHRLPYDHLAKRHQQGLDENSGNHFNQDVLQVVIADKQIPIRTFELTTDGKPLTGGEAPHLKLFRLPPPPSEQTFRLAELATQLTGQPVENWSKHQHQHLTFCWQRNLTHYYRGSAGWWVTGMLPPARHVLHYDMLAVQEHLPATFCEEMLATVPGWTQKIARCFGQIFDQPQPFTVQFLPTKQGRQAIQGWIAPEENQAVPIDAWGDGARAAFKLLTPLIALAHLATTDKPGLLLWEEPEMFQNPQTLGKLLYAVADIVRGKPIQIFMVSHSLEVVAHLTQMLHDHILPADETMTFLLNLQQGKLQSSWFDADNLLSWLESGLDPRVWGEFMPPVQFRSSSEVES